MCKMCKNKCVKTSTIQEHADFQKDSDCCASLTYIKCTLLIVSNIPQICKNYPYSHAIPFTDTVQAFLRLEGV